MQSLSFLTQGGEPYWRNLDNRSGGTNAAPYKESFPPGWKGVCHWKRRFALIHSFLKIIDHMAPYHVATNFAAWVERWTRRTVSTKHWWNCFIILAAIRSLIRQKKVRVKLVARKMFFFCLLTNGRKNDELDKYVITPHKLISLVWRYFLVITIIITARLSIKNIF